MPTASSLAWKTGIQDAVALQQIKGVALYLWLIVVISVRQSTVAAISGLPLPGAGYGQFRTRLTAWLLKFKRSGRNGQRSWCEQESPRLSPLWLSASSSACHGLLIITVITPLPTKHSMTKIPRELKLANAAITDMQMRQRDVAALRCRIHEELADAKAENDALWWCCAAGRRQFAHQAVCQSVREATTASGVDDAASPDWQTPLNGIISPSERLITMQNNWKEPRSILMSSADRVAHIDGQLMQLLWAIHTRFQRSINA